MGQYNLDDIEPIMTDLPDEDPSDLPAAVRSRPWIIRFASIFGLASQGQGSGPAGAHSGGVGGM